MLAYHFPPVGGSGVQRSLRFARYLREFGYEPVVVTGPGAQNGRYTPSDATLRDSVPAGIEVRRLGPEPRASSRSRFRLERWLRLPSRFTRWWVDGAIAAGADADVDLIYASMYPWESSAAAAALSRSLSRPWVADLRDPWALDEMAVYASALHRRLEIGAMRRALRTSSGVIMNTAAAKNEVERRFPELERVVAIPNGFDADTFSGADPERGDDAFRIVHTGVLYLDLGRRHRRARRWRRLLGSSIDDVDIITRSHLFLLEALERARRRDPEASAGIELHLAGRLTDGDRELIRGAPVHAHGFLPYPQTIDLVRSADLLFLPMHDLPPGRRARIVPGKTYEYLASGRPILAAVPDGDARDLLRQVEHVHLTRPADSEAMAGAVLAEARAVREHGRAPSRRPALAAPFERRELTRRLAAVFDAVLDGEPRTGTFPG
jgi:glycosyltransferase involved in cell wall biosynthesis